MTMSAHLPFYAWRYGMFVHFGLYSLLGRGEWVMNREQIPRNEYARLTNDFTVERFNAEAICDLAVRSGMHYIVFCTMHHDGFRLYDTDLSDFCATRGAARRDFVAEIVAAARKRGLRVGLYHSLNNWFDQPDAVDALEHCDARQRFIDATFARIHELVTRFNPVDVLWYDGWWPFDAEGWRAAEMNQMVRAIQPHILFNGRNGLAGDFATPENHLTAPSPWRAWEACVTLNESWGFHRGDHDWKTPAQVIDLLATVAGAHGNLLLNVGLRGDGSVPEPCASVLTQVGDWIRRNDRCVFDGDRFTFDLRIRGDHRGDWCSHGPMIARGQSLFLLVRRWPGTSLTLCGLEGDVRSATLLHPNTPLRYTLREGKLTLTGLPESPPDSLCPVIRLDCDRPPSVYLTGGMRVPRVPHPHYDPCPSDLANGANPAN